MTQYDRLEVIRFAWADAEDVEPVLRGAAEDIGFVFADRDRLALENERLRGWAERILEWAEEADGARHLDGIADLTRQALAEEPA